MTPQANTPYHTMVVVLGEEVAIRLEECIRQVEKPKRAVPVHEWVPFEQRYEFQSTDLLTLRILDIPGGSRVRQSWRDGKKQRVENCLNQFVIGLVEAAEAIKAARLERERAAEAQREAERRRLVELERREREKDRLEELDREIQAWRRAGDVRQYYTALVQAAEATNGELHQTPASRSGWPDRRVRQTARPPSRPDSNASRPWGMELETARPRRLVAYPTSPATDPFAWPKRNLRNVSQCFRLGAQRPARILAQYGTERPTPCATASAERLRNAGTSARRKRVRVMGSTPANTAVSRCAALWSASRSVCGAGLGT